MKNFIYLFSIALLFSGCSVENPDKDQDQANLTAALGTSGTYFGSYKGIFTTDDSEYRAQVQIIIPEAGVGNAFTTSNQFPSAILVTSTQDVFTFKGSDIIENDTQRTIHFESNNGSFDFTVDKNGSNSKVEKVLFKNVSGSMLVAKSTLRNALTTITGTYECTLCGNPNPMTFNVMISNDGAGNETYTTQMAFNGNTFSGIGLQNNCTVSSVNPNISFCNAQSGNGTSNVGFTIGPNNYPVEWKGSYSYSSTGSSPDCSELTGTWFFRKGTASEKNGTFKSDAITNCFTELLFENFDNTLVSYTSSIIEFTANSGTDYFIHTNGSNLSSSTNFNDKTGGFFAAQDIDANIYSPTQSIRFSNIDISTIQTLYFTASFAEDLASDSAQDWDASDYLHVEYSFNGGATWTKFFAIQNDGSTFNTQPRVDANLDGVGDSTLITPTFQSFVSGFNINGSTNPGNSTTVDIRIEMRLDSGDEDIAFDNVIIRGLAQ